MARKGSGELAHASQAGSRKSGIFCTPLLCYLCHPIMHRRSSVAKRLDLTLRITPGAVSSAGAKRIRATCLAQLVIT